MGYDIVTVQTDAAQAEAFAKQFNYAYLFDKEGKYDGGAQVYFRVNIWGMGMLANCLNVLLHSANVGNDTINDLMGRISYNQGDELSPELISLILDAIDTAHGPIEDWVDSFSLEAVTETWNDKYDGNVTKEGVANKADWTKEILVEWFAYLRVAKNLGGCQVW